MNFKLLHLGKDKIAYFEGLGFGFERVQKEELGWMELQKGVEGVISLDHICTHPIWNLQIPIPLRRSKK
ncbi:hypothetical protein VNO78_18273 [Psophocarpus tetragonolobus]|uniref:Uncharacterized protein n=1 Tax=Psophocarpus tetragonolobus TaxID=3891 RepID=A0AAN9XM13_PSOTE